MQGLLLVDKPAGWTSFDVVNYVRKIVATEEGKKPKNVKVGHCGTLDPFATGLLILLIGKDYTVRASELSQKDKTYIVDCILGQSSTTGDPEGEITVLAEVKEPPTEDEILACMQKFVGEISQIPPAFSAIKMNGKRAYELAREGKPVQLEPRKVTINKIKLQNYAYPNLKFTADVSSGTYIRTLVEDIAKELKTEAYTSSLRRLTIANYSVDQSISIQDLDAAKIKKRLQTL